MTDHRSLADALANQKQWEKTISEMHDDKVKYWVCCPLCDNPKCVHGTEDCEAEMRKQKNV